MTADPTLSTLPGSLPGLLRRGAPVLMACDHTEDPGDYPAGSTGLVGHLRVGPRQSAAVIRWDSALRDDCEIPLGWLALDLTDPAGMDIAARFLAEQKGAKVSGNAPAWELVAFDGKSSTWHLTVTALSHLDGDYEFEFVLGAEFVNHPRAALAAACLAVGGSNG
jgi:hypothetical protein